MRIEENESSTQTLSIRMILLKWIQKQSIRYSKIRSDRYTQRASANRFHHGPQTTVDSEYHRGFIRWNRAAVLIIVYWVRHVQVRRSFWISEFFEK